MSLLDTVTVLFLADTRSVERGASRFEDAIDKLLRKLEGVDKAAEQSGHSFTGLAGKAQSTLEAARSICEVITSVMERASDIHSMSLRSESIGIAVEEMDAFRRSVELIGGTSQGAQDSVASMASAMGAALSDVNSDQARTFADLGISLKGMDGQCKNAMQGILEVASAIQGMDKKQARLTIEGLGISDSETIELIIKGREEIEKMTATQKKQGVVTAQIAAQAAQLDNAMNELRGGLDRAGLGITAALLPAINQGIEWLGKIVSWANEHQDVVVAFFSAVAVAVAAIYLPVMISVASATLAATWPIIAVGAAVAALAALFALAYDDIMNFIDGNDSLTGQFAESYPQIFELVQGLANVFKALWDVLGVGAQQAFQFLANALSQILNGVKATATFIFNLIERLLGGIKRLGAVGPKVVSFFGVGSEDQREPKNSPPRPSTSGQSPEDVPVAPPSEVINGDVPLVVPAVDMVNGDVPMIPALQDVARGRQAIDVANASPFNATTSSAISNFGAGSKQTSVHVGEVVVYTQATDAKGIAGDINGELSTQLKQLESEYSSGVDR